MTFNRYQRENGIANRWKFQGQEHVDELNLGWDSFKWRNHQPDIGRFFNVDPLSEKYLYNSPYAFSENKVVRHAELEGLEAIEVGVAPIDVVNAMNPTPPVTGGDKILTGVGNIAFGAVGVIASTAYSVETVGLGAAFGGGAALALSTGEVAIGIAQVVDGAMEMAGTKPNEAVSNILQNSSSLPGLVEYGRGADDAAVVDAVGQAIPGLFTGGNLNGIKESWSLLKNSKTEGEAVKQTLNVVDAGLDCYGVLSATTQSMQQKQREKEKEEVKENMGYTPK